MKQNKLRVAMPVPEDFPLINYHNAFRELGAESIIVTQADDPMCFDGLLIPGGFDIDPARYGQENRFSERVNPQLDELQFAVLGNFVNAGKPVFGICRGHQLINVFFGGSLHQHLPSSDVHDWEASTRTDKAHGTRAEKGSWIAKLYGEEFVTNSAHHQAADRLGEGLVIDQYSQDGVIEAMHCPDRPVYSVQWHPERMCYEKRREDTVDGSIVLKWFLDMCKETKL